MAQLAPTKPSTSTDGRAVLVTATASPGTLMHTAVTGSTKWDEIWLYAQNNHTADVLVTVEFGGNAGGDQINKTIQFKDGLYLLTPGLRLQNGSTVKVFASVISVVTCFLIVNTATP